jgi:hypothetical protein
LNSSPLFLKVVDEEGFFDIYNKKGYVRYIVPFVEAMLNKEDQFLESLLKAEFEGMNKNNPLFSQRLVKHCCKLLNILNKQIDIGLKDPNELSSEEEDLFQDNKVFNERLLENQNLIKQKSFSLIEDIISKMDCDLESNIECLQISLSTLHEAKVDLTPLVEQAKNSDNKGVLKIINDILKF